MMSAKNGDVKNGEATRLTRPDTPGGSPVEVKLVRQFGLVSAVAFVVGNMIGSGIWASPTGVMQHSGSVGANFIVWALCGLVSLGGALCYAELGTMIPLSGGEYPYFLQAYGPVVAYLFSWINVTVIRPVSLSIISTIFSNYFIDGLVNSLVDHPCSYSPWVYRCLAVAVIMLLTFLNCISAKLGGQIQNFFTFTKIMGLCVVMVLGFNQLFRGSAQYLRDPFQGTATSPFAFGLAFYMGLWPYDGWNNLNFITEELTNPNRNLPRAISIGLPITTIIYLLTILAYLGVMSKDEMLNDPTVAILLGSRTLPHWIQWIIPLFVCVSTFGAVNGQMIVSSRLIYAVAREGQLPTVFSYISVRFNTPIPALLILCMVACLSLLVGDFAALVGYFSFTAWIFYTAAVTTLLYFRWKHPEWDRPYKVFLGIPIAFILMGIYLIVAPIINDPQIEYLYATLFILAGLLLYIPFIQMGVSILHAPMRWIQLILNVVPETSKTE